MPTIVDVHAREVLDSRGNPTVQADVRLSDGSLGRATIPSGASTGTREAVELRDGDPQRYHGKGVLRAVENVRTEIRDAVRGMESGAQAALDERLVELDGTANKSRLGANATLGVSLATAHAHATATGLPLYRSLGGDTSHLLPLPMMNVINGGVHADNPIDFQEFMLAPLGLPSLAEAVRAGSEVFHTLKKHLHAVGLSTNVGDEGGFAPDLRSTEEALDLLVRAIEETGYAAGSEVAIFLDPAASEFFVDGSYHYAGEGAVRSTEQHIDHLERLIDNYPILSIEDGLAQDDYDGWKEATDRLGDRVQLVGDDLFCTNPELLSEGIDQGWANSILIKVNQIGTLSEALLAISRAHEAGYHRSDVAPLRRDRGHHHRRPRRRHRVRPDQDRLPVPLGPQRQVEPADPDRGGTRRPGHVRRGERPDAVTSERHLNIQGSRWPRDVFTADRISAVYRQKVLVTPHPTRTARWS